MIKQKIELGKDKGNPKDSVNYFAKIEDLDSFYKYQILKKKNYTNYLEGEDEYTDYSNFDTRYVDKSTGIDTNGDTLPNREEGVYDKNNPEFKMNKIGYNDLFSKPHFFQGKTDHIVSRSYYSDNGDIRNVYKDSKCIPGKSCCNKDKECYPADNNNTENNMLPKTVYATCKPCPLGLLDTYTFNATGTNEANIINDAAAISTTGENQAVATGESEIVTGDAISAFNIANVINSNIVNSDGYVYLGNQILEPNTSLDLQDFFFPGGSSASPDHPRV